MLDRADLAATLHKLRSRSRDVSQADLTSLERSWLHLGKTSTNGNRAGGAWGRQLHDAELLIGAMIHIDDKPDLLAIKLLGAVHVGDRNGNYFELPLHDGCPFLA